MIPATYPLWKGKYRVKETTLSRLTMSSTALKGSNFTFNNEQQSFKTRSSVNNPGNVHRQRDQLSFPPTLNPNSTTLDRIIRRRVVHKAEHFIRNAVEPLSFLLLGQADKAFDGRTDEALEHDGEPRAALQRGEHGRRVGDDTRQDLVLHVQQPD